MNKNVSEVLKKYRNDILNFENVNGVCRGEDPEGENNEEVIIVYIEKGSSKPKEIEDEYEGFPVRFIEQNFSMEFSV